MQVIPATERLLLGPGPSPVAARVMRAMMTPVLGHLDPDFMRILDDVRARLHRVFRAPQDALALAISGTGSAGMEAVVTNLIGERTRVLAVVTGYFGDRLALTCARQGAIVRRIDVAWGRACDPDLVRRALREQAADIVAIVHAETSTGVLNPLETIAAIAAEHDALTVVDAVTSLGAHPVEADRWGLDACYSCTQKGIGAPSGLAPVVFSMRARRRRLPSRSFYFDLELLDAYWADRRYHHTISAPLIYALLEALIAIEEEGLEERWARHECHHCALVAGLEAIGLSLLPPEAERLWTLNAVKVPEGVDEAVVRRRLLAEFNIEIGAGLGPLAGRIWRIGLMGSGSEAGTLLLLLGALERVLRSEGYAVSPGAATGAAVQALASSPVHR